jgi:hypothetical protein
MPQQLAPQVENNFVNGLITEATGLNFPQNAVTDTFDCIFDTDGSVYRRQGFDFEILHEEKTINREDKAITTYLWKNVAGNGDVTVLVVQIGDTLYFYEAAGDGTFSPGAIADTVTLTEVTAAPIIDTVECQYSDGNGFLFVTHPYMDPIRISYDKDSDDATATTIVLKIRDFEGDVADPNAVDTRPTATLAGLNVAHKYNLYNQGWTTTNLTAWDTAQTTMPSNADVMWRFKDSSDNFDASTAAIARVTAGNTPAPKGHFILELSDQDRDTASGLSGVTEGGTSFQRPSTSAFFAGRMFYSGINFVGYNSNIYFTQIVERDEQYAFCHQVNDPSAEDLFDLLPSDGGVIRIPEAGTIYKLMTVPGGLCVFAANGVWFVTGSTGIGFTAVDYTVQKISEIGSVSASSFVSVAGFPAWWNAEGIYLVSASSSSNIPGIQSLSNDKIKTFFQDIPLSSKRFAKGFYHITDEHIRWIYRSESTNQVTNIYEYDRVLNFNVRSGAFYPWTIGTSDVKVNAIIPTDVTSNAVSVEEVVDDMDVLVVDDMGEQVITFTESGSNTPQFDKYLVSYADGGSYQFTFADRNNTNYLDWEEYDDTGVNYDSYYITGFKLPGAGANRLQSNYVHVFSRMLEPVQYYFQGVWDYANTGDGTGKWTVNQIVSHDDTDYSTARKRIKVRGRGYALQFRVSSVEGEPFDIVGWNNLQGINQRI